MQKENVFFFSFPSESNLFKVTNKRAKSAIKRATCKLALLMSEHELIIKMQKENVFFFSFPSESNFCNVIQLSRKFNNSSFCDGYQHRYKPVKIFDKMSRFSPFL